MDQAGSGIGNVAPNAALVQMAMSFARSRVVCAAARLGVADALGDEVRSVDQLAQICQANPDALYRLLRTLAGIGITEETEPRQFRLTPLGKPLRRDVPRSAWPAVVFWADLLADNWSLLTECVRTGQPAQQVRAPGVPSRWSQDPEAGDIFRAVMGTAPADDYAPIAKGWDFSRAQVVADLGGGGGALILAVLELYPHVRGMLVDLEPSVEAARPRFADGKLTSRCQLVAADLMESVPAGADVYMLKHVLHGRGDADAVAMLRNCRAVVPENGALLIIEFILPARVAQADPKLEIRLMSDLNMLAVTRGAGTQRTGVENAPRSGGLSRGGSVPGRQRDGHRGSAAGVAAGAPPFSRGQRREPAATLAVVSPLAPLMQDQEQAHERNGQHIPHQVAGAGRAHAHHAGTLACRAALANDDRDAP